MNLDKFILETAECLYFISKPKQLPFINYRIKKLQNASDRDLAEIRLAEYCKTNNKAKLIRPKTVCFSLHGIRTDGSWQTDLKRLIEENYENIENIQLKFGFWDAFSFLFPWKIDKPLSYIETQLDLLFQRHEIKDAIKVLVAHSYGTYVIYNVLKKRNDFKFDRIIFCGSVVSSNVDWTDFENTIIVNDCGLKDKYPSIAQTFSFRYGIGGLTGMTDFRVISRYHQVGHSGFFSESFMTQYWLPFIADGVNIDSRLNAKTPYPLQLLSILPGIGVWIILLSIIAGLTCFLLNIFSTSI